jgi:hypothetical protein
MSRGIGQLQRRIKRLLDAAVAQEHVLCGGDLLKVFAVNEGPLADPEARNRPCGQIPDRPRRRAGRSGQRPPR